MSDFDFYDTEACHLSEIYDDYEANMSHEEYIAEQEYERANTIAILAGIDEDYYTCQRGRRKKKERLRLSIKIGLTGRIKSTKTQICL